MPLTDVGVLTLEASWSTNPDAAPSWSSVPPLDGVTIRPRGRNTELDTVNPCRATIDLDNTGGAYAAGRTVGGGTATVDKRIRARFALNGGSTYTLFDHTIESLPTNLEGGFDYATSQITSIDYFDALAQRTLRPPYVEHTLTEKPTAFYTFGDQPGSAGAGDLITGRVAPLITQLNAGSTGSGAAAFGAAPMYYLTDDTTCLSFAPHLNAGVADGGRGVLLGRSGVGSYLSGTYWTLRLTFATTNSTAGGGYLYYQANTNGATGADTPAYLFIGSSGVLSFFYPGGSIVAPGTWNDGYAHTVEAISDSSGTYLVIDGVQVATGTAATSALQARGDVTVGCRTGPQAAAGVTFDPGYFTGQIGYVALFSSAFLATYDAFAHYQATTGWVGEKAGARLARILAWTGWQGSTSLASGATVLAGMKCGGQSALDACRAAADADDGIFWIEGDGTPTFRSRTDRYATTSVVTFNAPVTTVSAPLPAPVGAAALGGAVVTSSTSGGTLPVDISGLVFDHDRQHMVNDLAASRPGGPTLRIFDQASIDAHRTRSDSIEFPVTTDTEVANRGSWYLQRYSQPRTRVGSIRLNCLLVPALAYWALTLKPFDRITITGLPDNAPATTMHFLVESKSFPRIDNGAFICELSLSPWIPVFTIDDPVYGQIDGPYPLAY